MPRVSVLISAYNHAAFVTAAVESVLAQDFSDWEIVLRDDASADGTAEIVSRFRGLDARIRILPAGANLGGAESLNECLRAARGEYVAILNSDDLMLPDRLSRSLAALEGHADLGAVFSRAEVVDETGDPIADDAHQYCQVFNQSHQSRVEWLRHFLLHGNGLCHPSLLIRRSVYDELGAYDAMMVQLPDFDMWVRLCSRYEIQVLAEPVTKFRILRGGANASGETPAKRERSCYEYTKILSRYAASPLLEQLHEILPDWVRPADDRCQRLRALAGALMSRGDSAHHHAALDVYRQYWVECCRASRGAAGELLALMRHARPSTISVLPSPSCYVFVARNEREMKSEPVIIRPLPAGGPNHEIIPLPLGVGKIRLDFGFKLRVVYLHSLTVHDVSGKTVWDLHEAERGVQTSAVLWVPSAAIEAQPPFHARLDHLVIQPGGSIRLPLLSAGLASTLRYTVSVPDQNDVGAEAELMALRQESRQQEKVCERLVKQVARLEKDLLAERMQVESFVHWNRRPWYKRLFHRSKGLAPKRKAGPDAQNSPGQ